MRTSASIRRMAAMFVAGLVAATALAGCAEDGDPSSDSEFRMGTQPWLGYGPWYIAQDKKFAADRDVTIKLSNFSTDDQVTAALAGRKLDGANVATHTALKLIEAGVPISIVLLEDVSTEADAIAAVGIDNVQDLKGKKVAYEEGTTSDILLQSALDANGLSIDDVTKVPLPASDAGGALLSGRTPVAVTYEPYLTEALKSDKDVKLIYTAGETPGIISDVLVVHNDVIKENPRQVQALVDSWSESIDFYNDETDEARTIISKGVGAEAADLETAFEGVQFYGGEENQKMLDGEFATETLRQVFDAAKLAGILTGDVDLDKVINSDFVKETETP